MLLYKNRVMLQLLRNILFTKWHQMHCKYIVCLT